MEKETEREMERETTHSPQLTVTKNILPKTIQLEFLVYLT